jgi:chromosome partitioning protein
MIVALTGQKGGVGKSTIAICLAAEALARGRSVLLVDADPQGTARTWGDVAAETGRPSPTVIAMGATMHHPGQLPQVAAPYDVVVIDCPGKFGDVQRSALMVSDVALLPCGPSAPDAWALATSLELLAEARALHPALQAAIVLTRKQGRTAVGRGARDVLTNSGLPVLASELAYRVSFQEALAAGQGVTTYAPRDAASTELRALYDELAAFAEVPDEKAAARRHPKTAAPARPRRRG